MTPDSSEPVPAEPSPALKVTALYEDSTSGARAKLFADSLARFLGSHCSPDESMWRCDLLECPGIAADVTRAATDSEVLIVSLHGGSALPLAARAWLEDQLEIAARSSTSLVVLLLHPEREMRAVRGMRTGRWRALGDARHHLRSLCAEKHFVFFNCSQTVPSDDLVSTLRQLRKLAEHEDSLHSQTSPP